MALSRQQKLTHARLLLAQIMDLRSEDLDGVIRDLTSVRDDLSIVIKRLIDGVPLKIRDDGRPE